jgi:hypothetical protein
MHDAMDNRGDVRRRVVERRNRNGAVVVVDE